MQRTSFARMHCSLARGLELIGDWWSPLIIRDLFLGVRRFEELADDLGISRNLLTRRLASLQKNGIIERRPYQERPVRYDYRLSAAGRDLVPALLALTAGRGPRKAPQFCSSTRPADTTSRPRWSARLAASRSKRRPSRRPLVRAAQPSAERGSSRRGYDPPLRRRALAGAHAQHGSRNNEPGISIL